MNNNTKSCSTKDKSRMYILLLYVKRKSIKAGVPLTSLCQLVITVITHFGHAVFHVFQRISVSGAAPTNNLCHITCIQQKYHDVRSGN